MINNERNTSNKDYVIMAEEIAQTCYIKSKIHIAIVITSINVIIQELLYILFLYSVDSKEINFLILSTLRLLIYYTRKYIFLK